MTETARPDPFFIADNLALDLLNSVASPWGTQIEWLGNGLELLDWLERAGLVPPEVSTQFRERDSSEALDGVAAQARELREWFRRFIADHAQTLARPSALADLDRINHLLTRDRTYRQIEFRTGDAQTTGDASEPPLQWREYRRWSTPEDLLLPIARIMGDLICEADFAQVKPCEGPNCSLWFHDLSKNHTRRWCSMAVCGNRVKAAAHRAKRKRLATP